MSEEMGSYGGRKSNYDPVGVGWMGAAQRNADPREARYYIRRLARRYPNHRIVKEWTARLVQQTRDLLDKAAVAERKGQFEAALDFAETAARVWPELPELLPIYNRLAGRYQRLRVGVVDLPHA